MADDQQRESGLTATPGHDDAAVTAGPATAADDAATAGNGTTAAGKRTAAPTEPVRSEPSAVRPPAGAAPESPPPVPGPEPDEVHMQHFLERRSVGQSEEEHGPINVEVPDDLTALEKELLADLFAIVSEHEDQSTAPIDRRRLLDAFVFACEHHADQRRKSGEDFIVHPVGVAKICAGMRLDTETLCAALLHDTVEDTTASLEEVRDGFGEEVAGLVDGVTKLTGIVFQSRDEAQAENYRKMLVAMATDIRVILIKLADRLHNMRTLGGLPKQKQIEKAKETLEIYAPIVRMLCRRSASLMRMTRMSVAIATIILR